jgi:quinol monooxygenase YgiN
VERWESQAHLEAHSNSVHEAAVLARADELLIEPFDSVRYDAVLLGTPSKGSLGGSAV